MNSMETDYQFDQKNFFLQWVTVTVLASVIGLIIFFLGIQVYKVNDLVWAYLGLSASVIIPSVIIGYGGQKAIQHHLRVSIKWFLMTTIGAIPGAIFLLFLHYLRYGGFPLEFLLFVILISGWECVLFIGYLQWRELRRIVSRAGRWIWVSFLSFVCFILCAIFIIVIQLFFVNADTITLVQVLVAGVISGAVSGAINGFTLLWLLRRPASIGEKKEVSNELVSN
jgi:hypothetical protein